MDGSLDSTEIAFLWLVIFGVLVLFGFVIYLLCRSFTLLYLLMSSYVENASVINTLFGRDIACMCR